MLDLQALGEAKVDQAKDHRQLLAGIACSRGIALMAVAESQDYQDRNLVLQACELFMDAIQLSRAFVDPYLHLARAFIVFNDEKQALKYLSLAREIEPEHPDVHQYLEFLAGQSLAERQTESLVSSQLKLCSRQIETLTGQTAAFENAVIAQPALEALMDACDLLANTLDELSAAQVDISMLEPAYEALIAKVSRLQSSAA